MIFLFLYNINKLLQIIIYKSLVNGMSNVPEL